ncbi:MAG: CHAT domain-containing protein, partial [Thermodesulfobacteriota bacterium]
MTTPAIHFADNELTFWFSDADNETRTVPADENPFQDWIDAYRVALQNTRNADALLNLGRKIYAWLNEGGGYIDRLLAATRDNPRCMVFSVRSDPDPEGLRFLEVPWELLADQTGHLAADVYGPFCPVRRIGTPAASEQPSLFRLNAVFMAAAPRNGGPDLAYESEESAILNATGRIGMDLIVEESGALPLLAETVSRERPVDLLHLSCHGRNEPEPALNLEDLEGRAVQTRPRELNAALGQHRPRMLFLSACLTSEPNRLLNSFSSEMIRFGMPAVLGWGGSVGDAAATGFAAVLYESLARKNTLEYAVAAARSHLLNPPEVNGQKQPPARDWHLARLYLGPDGGGILCGGEKARRRGTRTRGHREFLDARNRQVPVASRDEFVGRRREIQKILRAFRESDHAGVMVRGFGRQGKSSLAARVAHRMADHRTVVVYGKFDAAAVLNAFAAAFRGVGPVRKIIDRYLPAVQGDPNDRANLADALAELLEGPLSDLAPAETAGGFLERLRNFAPFSGKAGNSAPHQPVLLVIDDFEQMLEKPEGKGLFTIRPDRLPAVRAVIEAFDACRNRTLSRPLITCRYRFTLPSERGDDLYDRLFDLHLPAMEPVESRKQAAAKARVSGAAQSEMPFERIRRCIQAARGNPGLQNLLFSLALASPEGCDRALDGMETYLKTGEAPEEEEILEFLKNLAVDKLMELLRNDERELLRASTLFEMPVPAGMMETLARSAVISGDGAPGARLRALGLWEAYEDPVDPEGMAVAINSLVRPGAGRLNEDEAAFLAGAVVKDLFECWNPEDGRKRPPVADYELTRLGVVAGNSEIVKKTAEKGLKFLENQFRNIEAGELARRSIKLLDDTGNEPPTNLLRVAGELCTQVGDMDT